MDHIRPGRRSGLMCVCKSENVNLSFKFVGCANAYPIYMCVFVYYMYICVYTHVLALLHMHMTYPFT